jgi:hypothetical protein
MIAEEFEAHWSRLSFEGRRVILEAALDEICSELNVKTPPLNFDPDTGFIGYDADGNEQTVFGTTDTSPPFAITIHYLTRIPDEGDRYLLDDPWEILNTVYHEFLHYSLLAMNKDETKEFSLRPGEHGWEIFLLADRLANQFYDDVEQERRLGRHRFRLEPLDGGSERRDSPPVYHRPTDPTDQETTRPIIEHATPTAMSPFGPFDLPHDEVGRSRFGEDMQRQVEEGWDKHRRDRESWPPPMPDDRNVPRFDSHAYRHSEPEPHRFPGDLSGGGSGHMPAPIPEPWRPVEPPLEPIPREPHRHTEPAPLPPPQPPHQPPERPPDPVNVA